MGDIIKSDSPRVQLEGLKGEHKGKLHVTALNLDKVVTILPHEVLEVRSADGLLIIAQRDWSKHHSPLQAMHAAIRLIQTALANFGQLDDEGAKATLAQLHKGVEAYEGPADPG